MALTDREIRAAKPDSKAYRLFDEKGMYLEVLPSGVKAFRAKVYVNGLERRCSLGVYGEVTLAEAHELRDKVRKLAAAGVWHVDEKRKGRQAVKDARADDKANLFGTWADKYFAHHAAKWSSNHQRDIRRMIERDIKPALASKPITKLTIEHGQGLIDTIVARGALTYAKDVRMYCAAIFKLANTPRPVKLQNPFAFVTVPDAPDAKSHNALPLDHVGQFLVDLQFAIAEPVTRIAMELLLQTALRTGELRMSRWADINEEAREWLIPAERMKRRREHVVPLTDEMLSLLAQLRRLTGGGALLLPNICRPDEAMSETTLLNLLYRMGLRGTMTPHGCRSLFSTWANGEQIKRDAIQWQTDAIEWQLAHVPRNKTRAAYNRHEFWPERCKLMAAWCRWLAEQERKAKVVPLRVVAA